MSGTAFSMISQINPQNGTIGNLTVSGDLNTVGNHTVGGDITCSRHLFVLGNVTVDGITTLKDIVRCTRATGTGLTVTANAIIGGATTMTGALQFDGVDMTASVAGNAVNLFATTTNTTSIGGGAVNIGAAGTTTTIDGKLGVTQATTLTGHRETLIVNLTEGQIQEGYQLVDAKSGAIVRLPLSFSSGGSAEDSILLPNPPLPGQSFKFVAGFASAGNTGDAIDITALNSLKGYISDLTTPPVCITAQASDRNLVITGATSEFVALVTNDGSQWLWECMSAQGGGTKLDFS